MTGFGFLDLMLALAFEIERIGKNRKESKSAFPKNIRLYIYCVFCDAESKNKFILATLFFYIFAVCLHC